MVTDWLQALKKWTSWLEGQATLPDKQSRMKLVGALGVAAVMLIGLVAMGSVFAPKSPVRHHPASAAQVPLFSPPAPSTTVPNAAVPSTTAVPKTAAVPSTGRSPAATPAAARGVLTASKRGHSHLKGRRTRAKRKVARLSRVRR